MRGRGECGFEHRPTPLTTALHCLSKSGSRLGLGVFLLRILPSCLSSSGDMWTELRSDRMMGKALTGDTPSVGKESSAPTLWVLPINQDLSIGIVPSQHPSFPQCPLPSFFLSPSGSSGYAGICGERSRISAKYKPGCSSFQIEQRSRVLS